ncbi:hypothetical protein FRC17_001523 [Serendipita sp. 399]|nr:hypothetical protein FRC17_001523 [Serendipita sp. 399]
MYPYQHPPSDGGQNSPSASQQFLGNVETAANRLKRVFGRKRPSQGGREDGTQSEAPLSRKLVPGPRVSSLFPRKDSKPSLHFPSSAIQALGHRLNKSSARVSYIPEERAETSEPHLSNTTQSEERHPPPSTPPTLSPNPRAIQRSSGLVPGPETSAAIEYILDSSNGSPISSSPPKGPQRIPSPRTTRRGSFDHANAPSSPTNAGKRRSMSLSMIPSFAPPNYPPPSAASTPPSSFSFASKHSPPPYPPHHRSQSAHPVFSDVLSAPIPSEAKPASTDANGVMATSSSDKISNNIKGKLSVWATPSSQARSSRESSPSHSKAASVVASIGPAATAATGLAVNLSRRAYEKVNSIWTPASNQSLQTSAHSKQGLDLPDSSISKHKRANGIAYSGSQSDAEINIRKIPAEVPAGPNLGTLLRPPFRRTIEGGGLVFGRPLVDCVRDTKPLVVLGAEAEAGIEARFIPALVLRCVQHVERWGVREEGLFRINGRTSHVNKIKSEFAKGADYDLQECGPGDLDPHAVTSVLKAFLRELPEPILTRAKSPLFEAAFTRAKDGGFMHAGAIPPALHSLHARGPGLPSGPRQGLPSNPRDNHAKTNSTSTVTQSEQQTTKDAPDGAYSPQAALDTLLGEFYDLASSLPRENKDLLLTVSELLQRVSQHSRTTKMPLSNLLLVFCPSMNMNPGILKILVDHCQTIFSDIPRSIQPPNTQDSPESPAALATEVQPPAQDANDGQEVVVGLTPDVFSRLSPAPIPADRLPTRKQSLRSQPDGSQHSRTTPSTTPSAYKDTFPPITLPAVEPRTTKDSASASNPSSRAPSPRQIVFNPSDMSRPKPPFGPRPQNAPPSPVLLNGRSYPSIASETSKVDSVALESGADNSRLPFPQTNETSTADQPPASRQIQPDADEIPKPDIETGVIYSQDTPGQLEPDIHAATNQPPFVHSSTPPPPITHNGSPLHPLGYAQQPQEPNPITVVDIQTAEYSSEKLPNIPKETGIVPDRLQMHLPSLEHLDSGLSSASSANTDATADIFNTPLAWPEVPKEVPVSQAVDSVEGKTLAPTIATSDFPLPVVYQAVDDNVNDPIGRSAEAVSGHQASSYGAIVATETSTPQYDHRRDASLSTITNASYSYSPGRLAPPNVTKVPDKIVPDDSSVQNNAEFYVRGMGDHGANPHISSEDNTIRVHAPRLTVNSKELLSADSFWAKELQLAIQSTSPPSTA